MMRRLSDQELRYWLVPILQTNLDDRVKINNYSFDARCLPNFRTILAG
jgi:hypothetical protein